MLLFPKQRPHSDFRKIFKFFRWFGFVPNKVKLDLQLSISYAVFVTTFALIYLAAVVGTFFITHAEAGSIISKASNYIQLLVNTVTFLVIFIHPILQTDCLQRAEDMFYKVDKGFVKQSVSPTIISCSKSLNIVFNVIVVLEIYFTVVDFGVFYFIEHIDSWYWLVAYLPQIFYSMAVSMALSVLYLIIKRFRLLNHYLKEQVIPQSTSIGGGHIIHIDVVQGDNRITLANWFHILFDLYDFSTEVGRYFGTLFLVVMTNAFTITTIQTYYLYVMLSEEFTKNNDKPQSTKHPYWYLDAFATLNLILLHFTLVILMVMFCEKITSQSHASIEMISDMKLHGSRSCQREVTLHKNVYLLPLADYCWCNFFFVFVRRFKRFVQPLNVLVVALNLRRMDFLTSIIACFAV